MQKTHTHHWYFYPGIVLLILLLLFGGFLAFLTFTEYRPAPIEPALQGSTEVPSTLAQTDLTILSFNTGYASLGEEADFLMDGGKGLGHTDAGTVAKNQQGIAALLQQNPADVYMLQEIDHRSARTYDQNQLEIYGNASPGYNWYYAPNFLCKFVPYPVQSPFGHMDSGVATFTKYPVTEAQRVALPVPFSWPLRIANLKRCILETRIPVAGTDAELVILNFHLEAYDSGEGKVAQTNQLLDQMQQEYAQGNYVIAGGDFNQIFPDVQTDLKDGSVWVPGKLEPLPADWGEWQYVYDDTVPTCRLLNQPYDPEDPNTQYYVIDGFIVSPNVEVTHMQTLDQDFAFSDHNPVKMQVSLQAAA